jgi:Arc/MetJ-type ribon-helix-helix transcriptional regulator
MSESVEMAKVRLQVTVREDIVKWIDQQIEKLRFASRSHAIEYALSQLIENEKKE